MKYIVSLLLLANCVHTYSQNASLSGKIIEKYTEQEVVGAKITLQSSEVDSKIYRTLSNPNGDYIIDNLSAGAYNGFITMLSFDTLNFTIEINQVNNKIPNPSP